MPPKPIPVICPKCKTIRTKTTGTQVGDQIERMCLLCGHRFTTPSETR